MERYGTHCEQTYRTNFNRGRAKCIDWVKFNLALCRRYLNMDGLLAIAIDPSYISKSGKMEITKNEDGTFTYKKVAVTRGDGQWQSKWNLFPFNQTEIMKSGGAITQNPGW